MITLSVGDLRTRTGEEIGTSEWVVIDQARIDAFADVTDDRQWIHVDTERANQAPFGSTIAHGFLTLSLVSSMLRSVVAISGLQMTINYGLNRVRFVSPVPAGARVRGRVTLQAIDDTTDGGQATWQIAVEREGSDKPCLVAEWLVRYYA